MAKEGYALRKKEYDAIILALDGLCGYDEDVSWVGNFYDKSFERDFELFNVLGSTLRLCPALPKGLPDVYWEGSDESVINTEDLLEDIIGIWLCH